MAERPKAPKYTYWRQGVLWARFTVNGHEYRGSLRTNEPKVARARVAKLREKEIGAAAFGEDRKTWEQACIEWGTHIVNEVGRLTAKRYICSLDQVKPFIAGRFVDEISKTDVLAIVKARRLKRRTNATIKRDLLAMSSVLKFAEMHDWRVGNPAFLIMQTMSEKRDPILLPTEPDYDHILTCLTKPFADLVRAGRLTGCRISELVMAERQNFNARAGTLLVTGKGNKRRSISLDQPAIDLIQSLPAAIGSKRIFHNGGASLHNGSFVFSKATKAAQKKAQKEGRDFTGFRFHDLRHWFAVQWLRDGRSIYDLQQHLGHTSVSTTEIYLQFLTVEEKGKVKRPAETALAAQRAVV